MQGTNMAPDISPEEACVAGAKAARDTLEASKHPLMLMDEMCDSETDTAYAMGWNSIWASAENKARWNSFRTTFTPPNPTDEMIQRVASLMPDGGDNQFKTLGVAIAQGIVLNPMATFGATPDDCLGALIKAAGSDLAQDTALYALAKQIGIEVAGKDDATIERLVTAWRAEPVLRKFADQVAVAFLLNK